MHYDLNSFQDGDFLQRWTPLIYSNSKKRDKNMMQLIIKQNILKCFQAQNIPHIQVTSNYY